MKERLKKRVALFLLLLAEEVVVASIGEELQIAYHGIDFRIGEIAILIDVLTEVQRKKNVLFVYANRPCMNALDSFLPAIANSKHAMGDIEDCSIATAIMSCFVRSRTS